MILDGMQAMKRAVGHKTAVYGRVCGPFALASHLRGSEIFMDKFVHLDELKAFLAYTSSGTMRIANNHINTSTDCISIDEIAGLAAICPTIPRPRMG